MRFLAIALAFGSLPLQVLPDAAPSFPVRTCASLIGLNLTQVADKPARIDTANEAETGGLKMCEIAESIDPKINFVIRLPLATWSGRYLQTGCDGTCGSKEIRVPKANGCALVTNGEFAIATTDMGHSGPTADFGDDPQLRIDFAYRGVHQTLLVAKAVVSAFYGKAPTKSYFSGCLDGGHEALIEAQRYPADFDGIAAGAPALNFQVQNTFYHGWNALSNTGPDGKAILTADDLPVLHKAVLAACDALDGKVDGVIADPRRCKFDPAAVLCAKAGDSNCLSIAKVEAVRKIYAGPVDATGLYLTAGGPQPGSELAWAGVYVPKTGGQPIFSAIIANGTIQHLAFTPNPPPGTGIAQLAFDRATFERLQAGHALYDATDPDLSAFAGHGGKLMMWHGWSDPHISPMNSIGYFEGVQTFLGEAKAAGFAWLFLIPGMYHCSGGEGAVTTDVLTPLINWVENGIAPDTLSVSGNGTNQLVDTFQTARPPASSVRNWIGASFFDGKAK